MVPFQQKKGESGTPLVPSACVPDAAGTILLCTHRAAPPSWIKIILIPSKFVYGWTGLCAQFCKELSLCINTLTKPKLEASSVKICTGLTTNCTRDVVLIDISVDSQTPTLIWLVSTNKPTTFVGKQALALPKSCSSAWSLQKTMQQAALVTVQSRIHQEGRKGLVLV